MHAEVFMVWSFLSLFVLGDSNQTNLKHVLMLCVKFDVRKVVLLFVVTTAFKLLFYCKLHIHIY